MGFGYGAGPMPALRLADSETTQLPECAPVNPISVVGNVPGFMTFDRGVRSPSAAMENFMQERILPKNVRYLNPADESEIDDITHMSLETLRGTVPELEIDPSLLSNYNFDDMRAMYVDTLRNKPYCRFLVSTDPEDGAIRGHLIVRLVHDAEGIPYANVFTLHVKEKYRKAGVAQALMDAAERLARTHGAKYLDYQAHVTNKPLRSLAERLNHRVVETRLDEKWPYVVIRYDLNPE